MNVISMMHKINAVANPMIRESSLPNFLAAPDNSSEFMGVGAFDQLDRPFDSYVVRRSQKQLNVFGHNNERVHFIATFATMPVKRLQEKTYISFDDEDFPAMVGRERHEVSPRRGKEPSRLKKRTSAA